MVKVCWDSLIKPRPSLHEKYELRFSLFEPFVKYWNQHGFKSYLLSPAFENSWDNLDFKSKTLVDIGCGFGDYYAFLRDSEIDICRYTGMDINPELARDRRGRLAVPHPVALLLVELLEPLERKFGLREAVAILLRPAADFGEAGVEELRQQTVQLLSFSELPQETFGRQLAFNIIPQVVLENDSQSLAEEVSSDVARLLCWRRGLLTMRVLVAPVFYGHCLQLHVRLGKETSLAEVREALSDHPFSYSASEGGETTPMDVSGEKRTNLYSVEEDGLGGFWLLAVAGELGEGQAEQAVRMADSAYGL